MARNKDFLIERIERHREWNSLFDFNEIKRLEDRTKEIIFYLTDEWERWNEESGEELILEEGVLEVIQDVKKEVAVNVCEQMALMSKKLKPF